MRQGSTPNTPTPAIVNPRMQTTIHTVPYLHSLYKERDKSLDFQENLSVVYVTQCSRGEVHGSGTHRLPKLFYLRESG